MSFTPSLLKKQMTDVVLLWCMLQGGSHLYTTTAPSCCNPASYCHLSATLQTMSIIAVNLQDKRAVYRIFITLLRFSFDSPSYLHLQGQAVRSNTACNGCLTFQEKAVGSFETSVTVYQWALCNNSEDTDFQF